MATSPIEDDLKDAICDSVSKEYFHRMGGQTRHYIPSAEVVLGAIATAFLVPFVKKLAELSAQAAWKKIAGVANEAEISIKHEDVVILIKNSTPRDRKDAFEFAEQAVRVEMAKYNFSDSIQSAVVEELVVVIKKTVGAED